MAAPMNVPLDAGLRYDDRIEIADADLEGGVVPRRLPDRRVGESEPETVLSRLAALG